MSFDDESAPPPYLERQLVDVVDPQAIMYGRSRYAHPAGPLFWEKDEFPLPFHGQSGGQDEKRSLSSPERSSFRQRRVALPWTPASTPAVLQCPTLSFRTERSLSSVSLRVPLTPLVTVDTAADYGSGHLPCFDRDRVPSLGAASLMSPAAEHDLAREASQQPEICRRGRMTFLWQDWYPHHLQLAEDARHARGRNVYQFGISTTGDVSVLPIQSFPSHSQEIDYSKDHFTPHVATERSLAHVVCVDELSWGVARALGDRYQIPPMFFLPISTEPPPILTSHEGAISISLCFPKDTTSCWLLARMEPILNGSNADDFVVPQHHTGGKIELDSVRAHVTTVDDVPCVVALPTSPGLPNCLAMTCDNEYWRSRLLRTRDLRRMMMLPFCWYAVRRWDEASEAVSRVVGLLEIQLNVNFAQRLHFIRAHLLHSEPPMDHLKLVLEGLRRKCKDQTVLDEVKILLWEYRRLQDRRKLCVERVQNIISLLYSHSSQTAASAAVRDSADMKQLSYLTTLFLPASFMAGVFGINSVNIDPQKSLIIYLGCSIPLTVMTIWFFVAIQINHYFGDFKKAGIWWRMFWPLWLVMRRRFSAGSAPPNGSHA
ncbi:hypothetical protein HGRIS_012575 [Hohenbuehelia grisea]|uniref:Mg2+ transporter protein n=1 Tax=Hohenbuehelia grisea TaxID=104357 RepID=A0ABR3ISQ8_9AGAR